MKNPQSKPISSFVPKSVRITAPVLALLLLSGASPARAQEEESELDFAVPANLQVPAGNTASFHVRGAGVQIYMWSAASSTWVFQAPSAVLFGEERAVVGIHYAGPTWQSTDGSKVVGRRLAAATVDANAIPWLLLQTATMNGPGVFADVTYIQRLRTRGGLAPSTPGTVDGQQALVPYSAEYVFYSAGVEE